MGFGLGGSNLEELAPIALSMLDDSEEAVRRGVAEIIGHFSAPEVARYDEMLDKLLNDPSPSVRWRAVMCSRSSCTRARLTRALSDSSADVRQAALGFLTWWQRDDAAVFLQDPEIAARLVDLLDDRRSFSEETLEFYGPTIRDTAAEALKRLKGGALDWFVSNLPNLGVRLDKRGFDELLKIRLSQLRARDTYPMRVRLAAELTADKPLSRKLLQLSELLEVDGKQYGLTGGRISTEVAAELSDALAILLCMTPNIGIKIAEEHSVTACTPSVATWMCSAFNDLSDRTKYVESGVARCLQSWAKSGVRLFACGEDRFQGYVARTVVELSSPN